MRPACSTCRFFVNGDQCRRFPPVGGATFSYVKSSYWCGEYEPSSLIVTENRT